MLLGLYLLSNMAHLTDLIEQHSSRVLLEDDLLLASYGPSRVPDGSQDLLIGRSLDYLSQRQVNSGAEGTSLRL